MVKGGVKTKFVQMPSRGEDILKGFQVYPLHNDNLIAVRPNLALRLVVCRLGSSVLSGTI